jgi:hypothetical protein
MTAHELWQYAIDKHGFELSHKEDFLFREGFFGILGLSYVRPTTSAEFLKSRQQILTWETAYPPGVILRIPTPEILDTVVGLYFSKEETPNDAKAT